MSGVERRAETLLVNKVVSTYEAGFVQRYHTHPRLARTGQTDAHHQWSVATLLLCLHPDPSARLLSESILHDTGERFAGDLPRPVKTQLPDMAAAHAVFEENVRVNELAAPIRSLSEDERQWLKALDSMECIMYATIVDPYLMLEDVWMELEDYVARLELTPKPVVPLRCVMERSRQRAGASEKSSVHKEK